MTTLDGIPELLLARMHRSREQPISYLLVKLATRCNLACRYCYWFRDGDVYNRPPVLTPEAQEAWLRRLKRHINLFQLKTFRILFHGGEPLLFGLRRFSDLLEKLSSLSSSTGCALPYVITTNGALINQQWAALFRDYKVSVTISVDGPASIHDVNRIYLNGRPSHGDCEAAFQILREAGVEPGILAVCLPSSNPRQVVDYFVDRLCIREFDILVPDATHLDNPASIAEYYTALFDYVYKTRAADRISIRLFRSMIRGLLGIESRSESIGLGPITTVTLLTDGALEPLDVIRTTGWGVTKTAFNVFQDDLEDIKEDPLWQELFLAGFLPSATCQACEFYHACGGGHVAARWSPERRFDNPSVYCEDYKRILGHIWQEVGERIALRAVT